MLYSKAAQALKAARLATVKTWRAASKSSYGTAKIHVNGDGATAVVFGGFGFKEKQMKKHSDLYEQHNFNVLPVLSSVKQLTTPKEAETRGPTLAKELMRRDEPCVVHAISGSFWTMLYMFQNLDSEWKDKNIKAIVFDSCPPMSNKEAFAGWASFAMKQPNIRSLVAPLFIPYMAYCGITDEWRQENHLKMFGPNAVIPRGAHCLFMRGKNDPVLNPEYVSSFIADVQKHQKANVQEIIFSKARHAMSVVEYPEEYKLIHVNYLLGMVPEWNSLNEWETPKSCRPPVVVHAGKATNGLPRYMSA
jgi:hypothetical protein